MNSRFARIFFIIIITSVVTSCSTKLVPKKKCLLNKTSIKCDNKNIDQSDLRSYMKQKPNHKIFLIIRFHLGIYTIGNSIGWPKFLKRWLTTIGEEPVIWDDYLTKQTTRQMSIYLKNKGYYDALVYDSIKGKGKKKVDVFYVIKPGIPFSINKVDYLENKISNQEIDSVIRSDRENSLLRQGGLFDIDILQNERERVSTKLKNLGYYNFSKEYVYYHVDTIANGHKADVFLGIKPFMQGDDTLKEIPHKKYKINNIYLYPDFDPQKAMQSANYLSEFDTLAIDKYPNFYFVKNRNMRLKPEVITQSVFLNKGEMYKLSDVEATYNRLTTLQTLKLVNIKFTETDSSLSGNNEIRDNYFGYLDCDIQLSQATQQSYSVALEGTNSSGNNGGGLNLTYRHLNLFRTAAVYNLSLIGALEAQTGVSVEDESTFNTVEYGTELSVVIPRFVFPIKPKNFEKRFDPKTNISLNYNYQRRPDYTRRIITASFGYSWKASDYVTHTINPLELSSVEVPVKDESFVEWIDSLNLTHSYEDHQILDFNYTYIFNNQKINKRKNFVYFKAELETAGFLLKGINNLLGGSRDSTGSYELLNTVYAQYVKADFDFRYYQMAGENNQMVYRLSVGAAYPYGNMNTLPFSKKFYTGGANSIRAWHVRSLGPGSFNSSDLIYPNQSADIKLEANLEYRFKMFWVVEGALFLDAGNIWAINKYDDREGALFEFDEFYKEIAIGTGFGTRLYFSFLRVRADFGLKIRDPAEAERWIIGNRKYAYEDWTLNIGIGYPF